jgi:formate-dependent nitrite reductase membrane component NrfD
LLALLALAVGLAVAIYPAYVLRQMTARVLWASSVLVPLFVASALHAGQASLALIAGRGMQGRGRVNGTAWRLVDTLLILSQVGLVTAYVWNRAGLSYEAAGFLTSGLPAGYLWIGVIAVGWVLPLGLGTVNHTSEPLMMLRGVCNLLGVFALRAWLVVAGQNAGMIAGNLR